VPVLQEATEARDWLRHGLGGRPVDSPSRPEILDSWIRSAAAGLRSDSVVPPYEQVGGEGDLLARAAEPALAGLADDLAGTQTVVVLADEHGRILRRLAADGAARERAERIHLAPGFLWSESAVGTNGLGTTLHRRTATYVAPYEHFADAFTHMCSAGAPIIEPGSGRAMGVVAASRHGDDASRLLLALTRHAAREVERLVGEQLVERELIMREHFLRARRQVRAPLALVARDHMMTNAAAARLVGPADNPVLWEIATLTPPTEIGEVHVCLDDGRGVLATFEAVRHDGEMVAALVRMRSITSSGHAVGAGRTSRRSTVQFGWESLSETELEVAQLAAESQTNREIAARLLVSPHTVDSHIRHIYCKLGIASRVQLTRLVLAAGGSLAVAACSG
jgi:sigma-54 dependent transcriptional regulator, acetoin dehydrogenase operon transcriptional activator AcoR